MSRRVDAFAFEGVDTTSRLKAPEASQAFAIRSDGVLGRILGLGFSAPFFRDGPSIVARHVVGGFHHVHINPS